jgi:hypothetical protein
MLPSAGEAGAGWLGGFVAGLGLVAAGVRVHLHGRRTAAERARDVTVGKEHHDGRGGPSGFDAGSPAS